MSHSPKRTSPQHPGPQHPGQTSAHSLRSLQSAESAESAQPAQPAQPAADPAADERARRAIRDLVEGCDPPPITSLGAAHAYGRWGGLVEELRSAHASGGSASVRGVYTSLLRANGPFSTFMAEGERRQQRAFKLRDLALNNFPAPPCLVPGLLPIGLSTLAGRPKSGKSWLVLQLLLAADSGGTFLGVRVPKTKALYLALEDSEYRLSARIKCLTHGERVDFRTCGESDVELEWPLFSQNGLGELRRKLESGGYGLVIIDTFSRILGRRDQMDQQEMTQVMAALQRMALDFNAAILLVDHHRKSARTTLDADPIDDILGSTAKGGVVDCALGLYRRHNEDGATLKLSGRDFGDQELALHWDAGRCRWNVTPPKPARPLYTLREQEALDAVAELRQASLKELVDLTKQNKGSLYNRLQNLTARGALEARQSAAGLIYSLPAGLADGFAPCAGGPDGADGAVVVVVEKYLQAPQPPQPDQLGQPPQPPQPEAGAHILPGRGQEVEGVHVLPGRGQEVEGVHVLPGRGQEVEGAHVLPGRGQEVEGAHVLPGRGQEVEGQGESRRPLPGREVVNPVEVVEVVEVVEPVEAVEPVDVAASSFLEGAAVTPTNPDPSGPFLEGRAPVDPVEAVDPSPAHPLTPSPAHSPGAAP